jgi:predicted dehydrogenase
MKKIKVGVIGCGNISGIYLKNLKTFSNLELAACADLVLERAKQKAQEFSVPKAYTVEELLSDKDIDLVVSLTVPKVHTEVNLRILEAGKHVYSEKSLGLSREEVKSVLAKAKKKGLLVGCAPDTFMGAGIQACRKIIDDGKIGEIVGATAFMMGHGPESWHPDPEFFYRKGAGPMSDMGPYYFTAMINLIGPVKSVTGMTRISFPERTITSKPKYGKKIKVEIPTFVAGLLEFKNGAIGDIITSFDVWSHKMPNIEIYGSKGTLRVPDPNCFDGVPLLRRPEDKDWVEVPLVHGFSENSRGLGVSDMANAIITGKTFRAKGEMGLHVVDIIQSIHESAKNGRKVKLSSTCQVPKPMPIKS